MDSKTQYSRWEKWLRQTSQTLEGREISQNQVQILVDSQEFVPPMLEAIKKSSRSVAYQFFGIEADAGGLPFAQALMDAKKRGVETKVILDSVELFLRTNGRWSFFPFQPKAIHEERKATQKMVLDMQKAGVDIFRYGWYYLLHRNHTKSLICDNSTLFIGGFNPTHHNCQWHEVSAALSGPLALEAQKQFNEIFSESKRPGMELFKPSSFSSLPHSVFATTALITNCPLKKHFGLTRFIHEAIHFANHSIWIENGYISDPSTITALLEAKKRGVSNIRLIAPAKSNHPSVDRKFRAIIPKLIQSGLEVYLYPHMTHAKMMVVDDMLISIGSANLESFSLRLQNEMNMVAIDPEGKLARQALEKVFFPDLQKASSYHSQKCAMAGNS